MKRSLVLLSFACFCFTSGDRAVWFQGLPQHLDESPSARVPQNGEGYGSWQRLLLERILSRSS